MLASLRDGLVGVHARSLEQWRTRAVEQAATRLDEMFEVDPVVLETTLTYLWKRESPSKVLYNRHPTESSPATPRSKLATTSDASLLLPTLPSRPILLALHSLAASVQTLGPPPSSDLSSHGRDLYRTFTRRLVGMPGWTSRKGKGAVQSLWDLRFLQEVGGLFEADGDLQKDWGKLIGDVEKEVSRFSSFLS